MKNWLSNDYQVFTRFLARKISQVFAQNDFCVYSYVKNTCQAFCKKTYHKTANTSIDWVNRSINWISLWLNRKFIRFRFWKQFIDLLLKKISQNLICPYLKTFDNLIKQNWFWSLVWIINHETYDFDPKTHLTNTHNLNLGPKLHQALRVFM